jgi:hypothetical protein
MNPDKRVEHPPRRGVLEAFALLVWNRRLVIPEALANPIVQGCIHQHAHRHDHEQGHDALGLFQIPRGGQKLRGFEESTAALGRPLAFIGREPLRGWSLVVLECMRGEDATTLLYHQGLAGRERRRQGPVELLSQLVGRGAVAWSAPLAVAWPDTKRHFRQCRGLHALRTGGQRLLRLGFTRKRGAAEVLERFEVVGPLSAEVCVRRALRLGTPRRGVREPPALHAAAIGRLQRVIAIAFGQRRPRGRVDLGPGHWRGGSGGWHAGAPLAARVGALVEMRFAVQGTVRHQIRRAIGERPWRPGLAHDLPDTARVPGIAAKRLQQQRDARLLLHPQGQHDWVEVRAMIPAIAAGEGHAVGVRRRPTLIAASDMQAGAIELDNRRGPPQTSGRRGGNEPRERCHPRRRQGLQGAPASLIMEVGGGALWRQQPVSGFVVKNHRDHGELLVHNA